MQQDDLFQEIFNDTLSLRKLDGRVFENIKARVSDGKILITDVGLPVQVGDTLVGALPNGLAETFVVDDVGFQSGIAGLPAQFAIKVHTFEGDKSVKSPNEAAGTNEPYQPGTIRPKRVWPAGLPEPLKAVGGFATVSPPAIRAPRISYHYPEHFNERAQANVFAEQMKAEQAFDEKKRSIRHPDSQTLRLEFVLQVFAAFAKEACALGMQSVYAGYRIEVECNKFLQHLVREAQLTSEGRIRDELQGRIDRSEEWKQYRTLLSQVAQLQSASGESSNPVEGDHATSTSPKATDSGQLLQDPVARIAGPTQPPLAQLGGVPMAERVTASNSGHAGRKAKAELNHDIARVVARFAPGWKDRLSDLCEALDAENIPLPEFAKWQKKACKGWLDVFDVDREGLVKAIRHRLDWVSDNPAANSISRD